MKFLLRFDLQRRVFYVGKEIIFFVCWYFCFGYCEILVVLKFKIVAREWIVTGFLKCEVKVFASELRWK